MASSLWGGEHSPRKPSGTDVASLGPSDLSDSGSDVGMGALDPEVLEGDSDSPGTGEGTTVDGRSPPIGADILPDHLEGEGDADLQAELDFDEDQVAEQGEDAAGRALDDPDLDDVPEDVAGLSEETVEEDADPQWDENEDFDRKG